MCLFLSYPWDKSWEMEFLRKDDILDSSYVAFYKSISSYTFISSEYKSQFLANLFSKLLVSGLHLP